MLPYETILRLNWHDLGCVNVSEYLQQVSEVLLYLLLPPADFQNQVTRVFLRELIANIVLLPVVDLITDPDYINQTIVWMVRQRNKGLYKGDDRDVREYYTFLV